MPQATACAAPYLDRTVTISTAALLHRAIIRRKQWDIWDEMQPTTTRNLGSWNDAYLFNKKNAREEEEEWDGTCFPARVVWPPRTTQPVPRQSPAN